MLLIHIKESLPYEPDTAQLLHLNVHLGHNGGGASPPPLGNTAKLLFLISKLLLLQKEQIFKNRGQNCKNMNKTRTMEFCTIFLSF